MTKKTIFLCHLRLAQTHAHHCPEHFQFHSEVVVEETVSLVDLPVMDATVMDPVMDPVMGVTVMVVTVMVVTVVVITITEVTAEVTFLELLELALEASWELLEENKCINCFGIEVSNKKLCVKFIIMSSMNNKKVILSRGNSM